MRCTKPFPVLLLLQQARSARPRLRLRLLKAMLICSGWIVYGWRQGRVQLSREHPPWLVRCAKPVLTLIAV